MAGQNRISGGYGKTNGSTAPELELGRVEYELDGIECSRYLP